MKKTQKQALHKSTLGELEAKRQELLNKVVDAQLKKAAYKLEDVRTVAKLRDELATVHAIISARQVLA